MKKYLGIDIGTTNTKAIVLREDGRTERVHRVRTPTVRASGVLFFDLARLEQIIDDVIEDVSAGNELRGISITSVGESVVPVRGRHALYNPLLWYDNVTSSVESRVWPEIRSIAGRETTGSPSNPLFSLYKILWMRELHAFEEPEFWLPVSSYFIYRYTGSAWWDFTHASRSLLLDISSCRWNARLLEKFDLSHSLGSLHDFGAHAGTSRRGTSFFLGGHDHLTGLYGIVRTMRTRSLILDSIGTSESILSIVRSLPTQITATQSVIGVAFQPQEYYILRGITFCGKLLETLALLCGSRDVRRHYERMNDKLRINRDNLPESAEIVVDDVPGDVNKRPSFSVLNFPIGADARALAHSAYLYLGSTARFIMEEVFSYAGDDPLVVASGAVTSNTLLMEYKATILGRSIVILKQHELASAGAALCAATGSGDSGTVESFADRKSSTVIPPNPSYMERLRKESDSLSSLSKREATH